MKKKKKKESEAVASKPKATTPAPKAVSLTGDPFLDLHGVLQNKTNHILQERLKEAIFMQLEVAMATGDVGSYQAQMLAEMHRRWICLFWKEGMYSKQGHMTLANVYISDLRFSNWYDKRVGKGAAQFLRDAIEIYVFRGGVLPETPEGVVLFSEKSKEERMAEMNVVATVEVP